jgi:hypothetical protein
MWEELSVAEQDAIEEARRVASRPGQHEAAAERLVRAFPGVSEQRALQAILECMGSVTQPRGREEFAACLLDRLRG